MSESCKRCGYYGDHCVCQFLPDGYEKEWAFLKDQGMCIDRDGTVTTSIEGVLMLIRASVT